MAILIHNRHVTQHSRITQIKQNQIKTLRNLSKNARSKALPDEGISLNIKPPIPGASRKHKPSRFMSLSTRPNQRPSSPCCHCWRARATALPREKKSPRSVVRECQDSEKKPRWKNLTVRNYGVKVSCWNWGSESSVGIGWWVWRVGVQAAVPIVMFGEAWRTSRARIDCAGAGDAVLYPC